MNTKISLALATAVVLPACSQKQNPDPTVSKWEFPLVEPARPQEQARPASSLPGPPRGAIPKGFRVPDVTRQLPNLRNQPSTTPDPNPGSGEPFPAPAPALTPGPAFTPAPEVTPGPELTPAPEAEPTPEEAPSEPEAG